MPEWLARLLGREPGTVALTHTQPSHVRVLYLCDCGEPAVWRVVWKEPRTEQRNGVTFNTFVSYCCTVCIGEERHLALSVEQLRPEVVAS